MCNWLPGFRDMVRGNGQVHWIGANLKTTNNGQGIMPAHHIEPKLADILEGKDTELNYVIDLIKQK